MMTVALAATREVACVRLVASGVEHSSGRTVAGDAVALQIGRCVVSGADFGPWRTTRALSTTPREWEVRPRSAGDARRPAAAEGDAPLSARARMMETARLLCRGQHARHEALRSSRLRRADAAGPNANVVVTRHGEAQTRWKLARRYRDLLRVKGCASKTQPV
ncbi:hypothetical protein [Methylocystis sp. Sn-Cys]|uniref:hypothetical protein n=1 Tax=Methylocystis sp. Sn-Cys TaxID=1701263 RepID=UPI00192289A3|nr:hypothetical protein [Methylocystis sp. Sn-Cys]MBL1256659.1 hypothetical protein [Methylocystis sp. Sn-Cys]